MKFRSRQQRSRSCTIRCARWSVRSSWSAKESGGREILPTRWRRRIARAAALSRRPMGSISCRSITEPSALQVDQFDGTGINGSAEEYLADAGKAVRRVGGKETRRVNAAFVGEIVRAQQLRHGFGGGKGTVDKHDVVAGNARNGGLEYGIMRTAEQEAFRLGHRREQRIKIAANHGVDDRPCDQPLL